MKTLLTASAISMAASVASASGWLSSDWTGAYAGGQLGYANVKPSGGIADGENGTIGLHAGYDYDFGSWVVGGEIDVDRLDVKVGKPTAATVDHVTRAKLKLGYDFNQVMVYAVGGPARVKTTLGSKTDPFYGLGMSFFSGPTWSFSGEYLRHDFKNIGGSGVDAKAETFTIRASYRF